MRLDDTALIGDLLKCSLGACSAESILRIVYVRNRTGFDTLKTKKYNTASVVEDGKRMNTGG
jgi:hypothetical protein